MALLGLSHSTTTEWGHLSWDLQHIVLTLVATTTVTGSSLVAYACVCRDWQLFFEACSFSSLVLDSSDISDLEQIVVGHRRELVKHIALHIALRPYKNNALKAERSKEDIWKNNDSDFSRAIWRLWEVLSTWERRQDTDSSNGQLTLELLADSQTDDVSVYNPGQRYSNKIDLYSPYLRCYSLEVYKRHCGPWSEEARKSRDFMLGEERTGSTYSRTSRRLFERKILYEGTLNLNFDYLSPPQYKRSRNRGFRLPQVDIATSFLVRREYYRNISPGSLRQILQSLPKLPNINLERLIYINNKDEKRWTHGTLESLLLLLSSPTSETACLSSLKRLTLFAEVREPSHHQSAMPDAKNASPEAPKSLVALSQNLHQLSVSFLVDAEDLFRLIYWPITATRDENASDKDTSDGDFVHEDPGGIDAGENTCMGEELPVQGLDQEPRWEYLTSLVLTSKILIRTRPQYQPAFSSLWTSRVNDLLLAAAMTAKMMPKLEVMEIWNCDKGQAGIFRYVSGGFGGHTGAEIVWQGTQQYPTLSERVLKAWRETALLHNPRRGSPLSVRMGPIDPKRIEGPACALDYLTLRKLVMHEVSAWQSQWEQRFSV